MVALANEALELRSHGSILGLEVGGNSFAIYLSQVEGRDPPLCELEVIFLKGQALFAVKLVGGGFSGWLPIRITQLKRIERR